MFALFKLNDALFRVLQVNPSTVLYQSK